MATRMLVQRMLLTHAWALLDMLHLVSFPQMWHIKSAFNLFLLFFAVGFIARYFGKTRLPRDRYEIFRFACWQSWRS